MLMMFDCLNVCLDYICIVHSVLMAVCDTNDKLTGDTTRSV